MGDHAKERDDLMARFGGPLYLNQGNGSGAGRHGFALTITLKVSRAQWCPGWGGGAENY